MLRALVLFAVTFALTLHGADATSLRPLGVLVFPGFEMLDFAGPVETWGNMSDDVRLVIVAKQAGEVESAQGVKVVAQEGFGDCPKLDLLLVPGGFGAFQVMNDSPTQEFVRSQSKQAEIIMSVCNGASILAACGILDGRPATTNKAYWYKSTAPGPKVNWVPKARWVDNGNVVTSSGVSAGIDMTLHVIERLFGSKRAERLAASTEYEWHRDPTWDSFAVPLDALNKRGKGKK